MLVNNKARKEDVKMEKQKLSKAVVAGVISGCLMTTGVVFADEYTGIKIPECSVQVFENGEPTPYSMYFRSCSLDVGPSNGVMAVNVTTKAFQPIDHIYHDVTIYKNGVWQSSDRYENWGKVQLASYIKVSAQSGDYIDVYVDHYTEHNGCVESAHSNKSNRF